MRFLLKICDNFLDMAKVIRVPYIGPNIRGAKFSRICK